MLATSASVGSDRLVVSPSRNVVKSSIGLGRSGMLPMVSAIRCGRMHRPHPRRSDLGGERARECLDGGAPRREAGGAGERHPRGRRGQREDRARATLGHVAGGGAGGDELSAQPVRRGREHILEADRGERNP